MPTPPPAPARPPRAGRREPCPASRRVAAAASLASALAGLAASAHAQSPMVLQGGPPVQVAPFVAEPGTPLVTVDPGTPNPFAGVAGGGSSGGGGGGDGSSGGGGSGGGSGGSGGEALTRMLGTSWGAQAATAAQSLGVNPSAVAATCVLESGCRATARDGGAEGVFQMYPAAFSEGLATALRANPSLASQVVAGDGGRFDPVTSAIAAAGYQMQAVSHLQRAGVANPTVLDTRGYYNFGPRHAVRLAQAAPSATMGEALAGAPPSFFTGNGITPQTTVGEWRAGVARRIGTAADQTVRM